MDNNYLITIDGRHIVGETSESVSLSTFGGFEQRDGVDYVSYAETEATGFEGDITTVMLEGSDRAVVERSGKSRSRLVIEKGQKHMCHYDTGMGNVVIGILAQKIENSLQPGGGEVHLRYALDVNASELSVNELNITVKENPAHV